jgi:hypothetical protein
MDDVLLGIVLRRLEEFSLPEQPPGEVGHARILYSFGHGASRLNGFAYL